MKVSLLGCLVLLSGLQGCWRHHNYDVPSVVLNTLQEKMPYTKDVHWTKKDTLYIASFKQNHTEYHVLIGASGRLKLLSRQVEPSALPAVVKARVQAVSGNADIIAVKELDEDGKLLYLVVAGGSKILVTSDGRIDSAHNDLLND